MTAQSYVMETMLLSHELIEDADWNAERPDRVPDADKRDFRLAAIVVSKLAGDDGIGWRIETSIQLIGLWKPVGANFLEKAAIADQSGETTCRIGSPTKAKQGQFVAFLVVVEEKSRGIFDIRRGGKKLLADGVLVQVFAVR